MAQMLSHPSRPTANFQLIALILAIAAVGITTGCSSDHNGTLNVTGRVVAVEPRTISEFESLHIIDEDGVTWEFKGGSFTGFTPSHLQEHRALGDPVKVWYIEEGDSLKVTRIEDG